MLLSLMVQHLKLFRVVTGGRGHCQVCEAVCQVTLYTSVATVMTLTQRIQGIELLIP